MGSYELLESTAVGTVGEIGVCVIRWGLTPVGLVIGRNVGTNADKMDVPGSMERLAVLVCSLEL